MRGRKPTPTALHRLRGTYNPTRHGRGRAGEPAAGGELDAAAPPAHFTPGQAAAWRHALEHAPRRVLRAADRGVLAVWCEAEERHRTATEAQARLDAGSSLPLLAKGKEGQPVPSPYLRIINHAALLMLRAASELGFSPAARPRLAAGADAGGAGGDGASSPWGELEVIRGGRA